MFSLGTCTVRQIDGYLHIAQCCPHAMDIARFCVPAVDVVPYRPQTFSGYCAIPSTDRSMDIAKYCLQIFSGYCVILSTDIQWILYYTVHRHSIDNVPYGPQIFVGYCAILSTDIQWILCPTVYRYSVDTVPYCP
jgi:hypothetical protein